MTAKIAYLSAEFGLDSSLPIYSGGLGVLAGDYIKTANDTGLPLVAAGILYRRGYFQQRILDDGSQEAMYPALNPSELPIERVHTAEGTPLFVQVPILRRNVSLAVWKVAVGNVSVYLLDADVEGNAPEHRSLTDRLYGGNEEERICHEIILGIGGVRVLRAVGENPTIWHLNEGHVAFSSLERIREYSAQGLPFETAVEAVKATTVFTTHTPVAAGHDAFPIPLIDRYLSDLYWQLGAQREHVLALGQVEDRFNMTRLAYRTSAKVNGVSKLHARVSKDLFHAWTPLIPPADIPVESVTNGVHVPTWLSPELKALYDQHLSEDWSTRIADNRVWDDVLRIPDLKLYMAHQTAKQRMIERLRLPIRPDSLVVGFARRFATYKRATLLFQNLDWLDHIIHAQTRHVCFVFAGKAHPNDKPGQDLIRRIAHVMHTPRFQGHVFLIENYDLDVSRLLVQGVDVWLNTPIKPMEASGTSGQKAGINGVLNCSIRDGWWDEGYNGHNGWAIKSSSDANPELRDAFDSDALYTLLENEIIPLYELRDEKGLPTRWIAKMKESIRTITPMFSTNRMIQDYVHQLYEPTLVRGTQLLRHHFEMAARIADYKNFMRNYWPTVEISSVQIHDATYFGAGDGPSNSAEEWGEIEAQVYLGPIWHQDVRVEAVGGDGFGGTWRCRLERIAGTETGVHLYRGYFKGNRETWMHSNANVRVYPTSREFTQEFELELSTWYNQ